MFKLYREAVIIVLLVLTFPVAAQKNYVEADGIIEYHNRIPLAGATLTLFEGDHEIKSIKTNEEGRYNFILEYNKEYILEISKKNMITKKVKYKTVMPPKAKGGWWVGIPINLYELCPGLDASVFDNPVAVVMYDRDKKEYEADPKYDNRMRGRIRQFENKNDACLETQFVKLVRDAEELAEKKQFDEARALFEEAAEKRPWEPYPQEKLQELGQSLAKQDAKKNMYNQHLKLADRLFNEGNYIAAKSYYKRATTVLPSENYPREKIKEIDARLDENEDRLTASIKNDFQNEQKQREEQKAEESFQQAIAKGNAYLVQKNYDAAKSSYVTAQQIKPENPLPRQKLEEINRLLMQQEEKKAAELSKEREYKNKITLADNLVAKGDFEQARNNYAAAQAIQPSDPYPQQKISEINSILEKQAALAEQNALKQSYEKAIKDGDGFLAINEFALAKQAYNKATSIMPEEVYPKQKIAEINEKIAAQQQAQRLNQVKEQRYQQFVQLADNYYDQGELEKAKNAYEKAQEAKPSANYPGQRLNNINEILLAEQQAQQQKLQIQKDYQAAIQQGNNLLEQGSLDQAKLQYMKALRLKGQDKYATTKIEEIDVQLLKREAQKQEEQEKQEQFNALIAAADQQLKGAKYADARDNYEQAVAIEPESDYARKRIAQINDILAKLAASNAVVEKENKKIRNSKLPEMAFKNDDELQVYLIKLKRDYPEGITLEIYKEEKRTIRRYIIVRDNEANEFREIQHYWGGRDYSWNDKPITLQYFKQQTKQRTNEYYNVVNM